MRLAAVFALLLAARGALAATLPFNDGFEPPQTNFSNWTSTRLNGSNALAQSPAQAWDDARSMQVVFAGAGGSAQAAAVVDFSAAITTPFVRFWLYVPPGTEAGMAAGSAIRLVRLGDALSGASGGGGTTRVALVLRKDTTGPLYLRLDYSNSTGGTTPLGTMITSRITEGTWHYVELAYQPAIPRVQLYVDDPIVPRIDVGPSDTVAHNLLTAWVGVADFADAQSSPVTLHFDAVHVGSARVGTAQAISQHFNELESGTLAVGNTPPGKASTTFSTGGTAVSAFAAAAAAHRGGFGLRVADSDGQSGPGGGAGQITRLTATAPTLYRRFWWRPSGSNGSGSRTLAAVSSSAFGSRALAEVLVAGDGTLSLGGYDAAQSYLTTSGTEVASPGKWQLVELVLTGIGSGSGVRRLYLDGALAAQATGLNFTGLTVDLLVDGQVFSTNRTYQGTDDFDDLRAAVEVMPSRLVLTAPALTDQACSGAVLIEARDSDGTPRGVPEPTVVTLQATGVAGSYYSDPACTSVMTSGTIPVGTSQLTVYFRPTTAGSATLTASNVDLLPVPGVVEVASLATRVGFGAGPQTVTAGSCSAAVTAQAQTAGGAPATVGSATAVSLSSGSGTLAFFSNPACTVSVTSVTILEGQAGATFYFRDTAAGAPGITLAAVGLASGAQTETIIAAAPSKLVPLTPPRSAVAGVCSQVVTFQSQDTYGNPSNVAGATSVGFTSSSTGASFFTDAGCTAASGNAPIAAGANTVDIYFEDTRAGAPVLTAAAAGFLNGTQPQTITPAGPAALAFSSAPQNVTAGACSGATVIEVQDAFGNPTTVSAATAVGLSANPGSVVFYSASDCTGAVSQVTVPSGGTTQTFYFIGSAATPVTLSATSAPLAQADQVNVITASGPTRLAFISAPVSVPAGNCSGAMQIQAQDSFGNPANVGSNTTITLTSTSGSLAFFSSGGCGAPGPVTQVTMVAGTDTATAYLRDTAAGQVTVTASATGLAPGNQVQTVRTGPPSQLAFSTAPRVGVAGECLGPITAQSRDGFGNPATVNSATAVTLATGSSAGGFYSDSGCTSAIGQATIAVSAHSVSFYYRDTRTGTPTLTASNPGLSAPTQQATVGPAAPAKLVFTTAPQTLTAGDCGAAVTVVVRDAFDNPSPVAAPTQLALTATSATFAFHADPACSAPVAQVTVAAQGTSATFYFTDPTAGAPTLTARSTGLTDATQGATINRGPAAKLAFVTPPRTPVAGACSQVLTVESQDATGNAVVFTAPATLALSTSSSTGGPYLDAACTQPASQLSVPANAARASFYFKDEVSGPWGVTVTAAGLAAGAQTVTVLPGPAAFLVLRTPRQTLQAGTCSSAVTADLEDALGNLAPVAATTTVGLSSDATSTRFFLSAACAGAVGSVDLAPGESRVSFFFSDTRAGNPRVSISVPGVPQVTQGQTIYAGPPVQLAFTSPPQTVSVNTCSARADLEVQDMVGNPAPQAFDAVADLATSSGAGGFFSDRKCLSAISQVAIPADGGRASFYFQETQLGAPTLTATTAGLDAGAQVATVVTPGPPAALAFASEPQTIEALACSAEVLVELKDQAGNNAPAQAATAISLSAAIPGTTFHSSGACGPAVSQVSVAAGEYRASFHFVDSIVHTQTLTASASGLSSASQQATTVCPAAVDGVPCDDADLCNGRETCRGGACGAGSVLDCDDGDPCTADTCAAATGCAHAVIAGCCRSPAIAPPNLEAAVGVPYRVGPGGQVPLLKGTGPLRFEACDAPPTGLRVDATTGVVSWTPAQAGAQPLCLQVTGACGADTVRFSVQVQAVAPAPPTAAFTLAPSAAVAGIPVAADASASTGAAPLSYEWTWGASSAVDQGAAASHTFLRPGSAVVRLRVYDAVGQRAEASQPIAIAGPGCVSPGTARIVADVTEGVGSLTANFSCDCPGVGAGAVYRWDFADASSLFGPAVTREFGPGATQVRLEVSDGACVREDTAWVTVRGAGSPPFCSIVAEPAYGAAPLTVRFAARFGSETSAVESARWAFSDALTADALLHDGQVSRTLESPGGLAALLTVVDTAGERCQAFAEVTATSVGGAVPPRIESVPSVSAACGEAWQYDEDGTPTATGTGPLRWSLGTASRGAGAPEGMTVDEATGVLTWTPGNGVRGPVRVTLVAANEAGATAQDFLVEVACAKSACGCGAGGGISGLAALVALWVLRRQRRSGD